MFEVKTALVLFVVIFVEVVLISNHNGKNGKVDDEIEEEEIARGVLGVVVLARRVQPLRTADRRTRWSVRLWMP